MAYFQDFREDEDEENSGVINNAAPLSGGSMGTGGGGQSMGSAPAPANTGRKGSSGGFVNLIDFLNANQTQAEGLGKKVAANVGDQIQEQQQLLDTAGKSFEDEVTKNANKYNQGLVDQTIQNPNAPSTEIVDTLAGTYKGPQDFRSSDAYGDVGQKTQKLKDIAEISNTSNGVSQLVNETFKSPTGKGSYDAFLVQNSQPAWSTLLGSLSQINPAVEQTEQRIGTLNQMVDATKQANQQVAGQTRTALTNAQGQIRDDVNKAVEERKTSDMAKQNQLKTTLQTTNDALASGNFAAANLDDPTLASLGVTRDQWNQYMELAKESYYRNAFGGNAKNMSKADLANTQNYNLNNFLQSESGTVGTGDVATQEQKDRYTGLQKLLGDPSAFFSPGLPAVNKFDANAFEQTIRSRLGDSAEVGGDSLSDVQGAQGLAEGTKNNNATRTALTGAASGAATGAQIAGYWGAIIGAVVGFVASGGINASLASGGFKGTTIDEARANKDYARLGSNPAATLASSLGVKSDSALGKALDPIPSLSSRSANDTQGTKDWKSYRKSSPESVAGRSMSAEQIGGVGYHALGKNKDNSKSPARSLAIAFGDGSLGKPGIHATNRALTSFIDAKLADYMKSGTIPSDPAKLATVDGQKVFNNLLKNDLDAFIQTKVPGFTGIQADSGNVEKYLADLTDYLMYTKYAKGK